MKNKLHKIAAAVSAATLAGSAQAGIVTSSISLDQFLSGGAGYSGTFALSPLLAANGLAGGTFNSATLSAFGYSDTQINQSTYQGANEYYTGGYGYSVVTGYYSYSCGSWWNSRTCYGTNYGYARVNYVDHHDYYDQRDTVADSMRLTSGTASASDTVDNHFVGSGTQWNGSGTRYNGTYGYDQVNYYRNYSTYAYSGSLYAELGLGANDLLALAQSGQFDFLVSATTGNFHLTGLSITLDVSPAVTLPPSQDVPEPGSALLLAGGLAALAAAARRRKKA